MMPLWLQLYFTGERSKHYVRWWVSRKNSRRHNSIYNIYWLLTRFKFVRLLTQLFPSNLEVHFTSALSWPARSITQMCQFSSKGWCTFTLLISFLFWAQVVCSRQCLTLSPLNMTACKVTSQAFHFATALSNKKAESYYSQSQIPHRNLQKSP